MPTITATGAWLLTVALVYILLSGPFSERLCQTDCTQMVALGAVVVAVIGFLLSLLSIFRWQHYMAYVPLLATAALLVIFGATTVIGVTLS